jgi:hypothetical protein
MPDTDNVVRPGEKELSEDQRAWRDARRELRKAYGKAARLRWRAEHIETTAGM